VFNIYPTYTLTINIISDHGYHYSSLLYDPSSNTLLAIAQQRCLVARSPCWPISFVNCNHRKYSIFSWS